MPSSSSSSRFGHGERRVHSCSPPLASGEVGARGTVRAVKRLRNALTILSFTALGGCAHAPSLDVRRTEPALPKIEPGAARTDEVFEGVGRVQLYARAYRPEVGEVRGVVVFTNGLKDHGDHYAQLSQELVGHGYAAYAFDLRGHGRSAGERASVDRFDDCVDDLQTFVERVRAREPGKPIFVFGHSMAGPSSRCTRSSGTPTSPASSSAAPPSPSTRQRSRAQR
jgi:hypothetical protein